MEVDIDPRLELDTPHDEATCLQPHSPLINILPTEILLHIFQLTCHWWWRTPLKRRKGAEDSTWSEKFRRLIVSPYPEVLSHVCSLWREIVLSSPGLWSQIDLFTLDQSSQGYLNRASAMACRAQNHPLMLKCTLRHHPDYPNSKAVAEPFCSFIGPRLKSVRIDNEVPNTTLFSSIIQATISHVTPGILTDLTLTDYCSRPQSIVHSSDYSDGLAGWTLPSAEHFDMSKERFSDILQSIRVLRLTGQFFPWDASAYRGLVDLRLLCTRPRQGHRPFIKEAQLRDILLSCPDLRILHFGIKINGRMPRGALSPVSLPNLEELDVKPLSVSLYEDLFPLLAPGDKPFKLVCKVNPLEGPSVYCPAVLAFFRRSKITQLYLTSGLPTDHQCFPLERLLTDSPASLLTLGLEGFRIIELAPPRAEHEHDTTQPSMQLDCLCLRKCTFGMHLLREMATRFSAQVLKLHVPLFEDLEAAEEENAREEVKSIFPAVKWVYSVSRMEQWDTWVTEYIDC